MATDTLVLKVSESVYGAAAQFTVTVDGKPVGGTYQTTAIHGWKSDTVTLSGDWDKGNHIVSINYLNDFKDVGGDRNLFLDSATYDGVAVPNAKLNMWSKYDPHTFTFTDTTALAPAAPAPAPPPPTATVPDPIGDHDGTTDLNILVRGQSNAFAFFNYGGAAVLQQDLQNALHVKVNLIAADQQTLFSATKFMDWDTGGQQQKLINYVTGQPVDIKNNETITIWMHNEYDQQTAGLLTADWVKEVRTDASLVRDALDHQTANSTPYLFVPIRFPYGSSFPAIKDGMTQLSSDSSFHAVISNDAYGSNILMNGGPESGNNASHMSWNDAQTIGHALTDDVAALYHSIA
jgi:hypothetical protein